MQFLHFVLLAEGLWWIFLHSSIKVNVDSLAKFCNSSIFASYVIKLKQNNCFADWIQFRNTFPLSSFLLVTACVLTFFKAINCSTWSSSWTSLLLDKTKKTVIIVFIIHYRKFVWHMDDCSVICMSWVNLRDRVGKERWWQTLCDNRDNIFVWNNLPLNFTLL